MSEKKKRKVHTPDFKAKVGLEAVKGMKTINEIGQAYGVHPVQVGQWKKAIMERAQCLFKGNLRQLLPRFSYIALRTPPVPQRIMKVAELSG